MAKVDIEELKKLNYEQGAELLTAAGYVKGEESTADAAGLSDFVRDEYWRLYDEDGETADTVTWAEFFNFLKHTAGDMDNEKIICAGWERVE